MKRKIFKTIAVFALCVVVNSCSDEATTTPAPTKPQNSDQLIPLAVGNQWVTTTNILNKLDTITITKLEPRVWADSNSTPIGTFETYVASKYFGYRIVPEGVYFGVANDQGGFSSNLLLPKNPEAKVVGGYTWTKEASLVTPAGTFTNVWKVVYGNYTTATWYKQGIGVVKRTVIPYGELVSYTLK